MKDVSLVADRSSRLNSRVKNAKLGRFFAMDPKSLLALRNLYRLCGNNKGGVKCFAEGQ